MTIDLRFNVNIDGKDGLYALFKFALSKPCEGGEDFHEKPRQARENTRPHVLDWVHGLGPCRQDCCPQVCEWASLEGNMPTGVYTSTIAKLKQSTDIEVLTKCSIDMHKW